MKGWGIDFGTTTTGAAEWDGHAYRTFGATRDRALPSVVAIHKLTGEVTAIGEEARRHAETLAAEHHVVRSVKVLLETGVWPTGARTWTAEEVTSEILKAIRKRIIDELPAGQAPPSSFVFSMPVGFPAAKRRALRRAAKAAGIEVATFISEPTAAICRYFPRLRNVNGWRHVAVFDWGGGTLDVSVAELSTNEVRELATGGQQLGGDDLDRILAEHVHARLVDVGHARGAFDMVDADSRDRLLALAERAKRDLSSGLNETTLRMMSYAGGGAVNVEIDGVLLPSLFAPQFESALDLLERTVRDDAQLSFDQLGGVLLVGGSSKLRGLEDFLRARLPCSIDVPIEGDGEWSVAEGAALLSAHPGQHVVAQDIGLRVSDGSYYGLIHRGRSADVNKPESHYFGLITDEQEARFVFAQRLNGADGGLKILDYMKVAARGFSDELIELKTSFDEDLVLRVNAVSEATEEERPREWQYEKLRFAYRLPAAS